MGVLPNFILLPFKEVLCCPTFLAEVQLSHRALQVEGQLPAQWKHSYGVAGPQQDQPVREQGDDHPHGCQPHQTHLPCPASSFSVHSFRRGGASYLYSLGADPLLIQATGDWKTDCYA